MQVLAAAVARTVQRHAMLEPGACIVAGVSGGADSVALIHVLVELAPAWRLSLHVLHVDHGLRADSARDADFVLALGTRLGVPVEVTRVAVGPGSVEAAARTARYAALEHHADRVGASRVAVAHTADDQAETVLMRLVEGTGVRGLAGMPIVRGRIVRPLLETRRADVREALARSGVSWIEDPSNTDQRFFRNRVRHQLLPWLSTAWGTDLVPRLIRTAAAAREAVDAVDRTASAALDALATASGGGLVLSRSALVALPPPVAAEALRQAAVRAGGRGSLRAWGHRALRRMLHRPAPRPFRLGRVVVECSGDRVRVGARPTPAIDGTWTLDVPGRLEIPGVGIALEAVLVPAAAYQLSRVPERVAFDADRLARPLLVRARRRGDRFHPFGATERRLKSFLIDAKVPRWERDRVPLVAANGEIVWVAGLRRGAEAPVTPATRTVLELRMVRLA